MAVRVTSLGSEVLDAGETSRMRVSSIGAEVLYTATSMVRVSSIGSEVLYRRPDEVAPQFRILSAG
jgi:hypothetical protein